MPLISVVIPVHGVEDYLDRCLDSVLSDPAARVEVIAVDDASPDRCGAILAAREDPRLRVLATPVAGGPGAARDLGAKEAAGEYVWFVDGDDELAEGALAAVAEALTELRPDVLAIDYENLYPDGTTGPSDGARYLRGGSAEPLRGEAGPLAADPGLIHLPMTAWSKVYRRDFLAGLGISFGSAGPAPHEDVPVTTLALLTAGRIGVLDRVCYRYRRARRGSYLAGVSPANFNIFGSYQRIFNFITERGGLGAPVPPAVYTAVFDRAIWHYTTLLPLVPHRRRREFFRRMSADFRRWRPAGYQFPTGPRGAKFRLVARGAYGAYALLDPVNRLRVRLRGRK
jgi:CDP-glycerol glycerophosphotransferase